MMVRLVSGRWKACRRRVLAALVAATATGLALAGSRDFWRFETSGTSLPGRATE